MLYAVLLSFTEHKLTEFLTEMLKYFKKKYWGTVQKLKKISWEIEHTYMEQKEIPIAPKEKKKQHSKSSVLLSS